MAGHMEEIKVTYHLRDKDQTMVDNWIKQFEKHIGVEASCGDIFAGAPQADAVVMPMNSFGFMNGGLDTSCKKMFGEQLQTRLRRFITDDFNGEILVGQATITEAYGEDGRDDTKDLSTYNQGDPIQYVICVPTMRIPSQNASDTVISYLAFRAVILAVQKFNKACQRKQHLGQPITTVLVPGLATCGGGMPKDRCAFQMLQAYETFDRNMHQNRLRPQTMEEMTQDHNKMRTYTSD